MKRSMLALVLSLGSLLFAAPGVLAAGPVCPPPPTHEMTAGGSLALQGGCTDPELGPITYSVVTWPAEGSLVGTPDGSATYTPRIGFADTDTFVYRATDQEGLSADVLVTIIVHPVPGAGGLPPSCPDPTQAFVPFHGEIILSGNCRDPEGATITYALAAPFPTFGDLFGVSTSSVKYVHTAAHTMSDSFGYTANDGFNTVGRVVSLVITPAGATHYSTPGEPTPEKPFGAAVDVSDPTGVVVGVRSTTTAPPEGYAYLALEYNLVIPPQSPEDPIRLTFTIDRSQVPLGDQVEIFRNGDPVTALCSGLDAIPDDPCVLERGFVDASDTSDYRIVVLTSAASVWNAGTSKNHPFGGFFRPVDNVPTLNIASAGRAVPLKFSVGGDEGLDVLPSGSPSSRAVKCPSGTGTDELESVAADSASGLSYDRASGVYTYVWKTSRMWAGSCRKLSLTLDDGTAHEAIFSFR